MPTETTIVAGAGPHSYASTQVQLPPEISARMKAFQAMIPPDDLDTSKGSGLEGDHHITVKYGLHSDSAKPVADALKDEMPARFRLGGMRVFPANEQRPESDALVCDVHSPDLHRLNQLVSGATPHVDTHADYDPHATVAYLKAGRGGKYSGRQDLAGAEGMADTVVHSARGGKRTSIKLGGTSRIAAIPDGPIVLDASDLPRPQALPLALEGLPTFEEIPSDKEIGRNADGSPIFEIKRIPITYYRKEIYAGAGKEWAHRGEISASGSPRTFSLSRDDMDQMIRNFRELKGAGVDPFLPDYHTNVYDAAANNGTVIDLERKGDSLFAKMKVVGSAGAEKVLKNNCSVWMDNGDKTPIFDAHGRQYKGWVLHHVALTPNPTIPNLSPFARIAASADRPAMEAPVFSPAVTIKPHAAPSRRSYRMKPETAQQVRAQLGFGADVPDDQLDDKTAEKALALSAEYPVLKESVTSLTARLTTKELELVTAKTALDAKSQENLALSATAPRMPDPVTMAMYAENVAAKREMAIQSGAITPAEAVLFDQLVLDASGKPTALALSACAGKPLGFTLWDVVCKLGKGGFRSGTARGNGLTEATPNELGLSAEKKGDVESPEDVAWLRSRHGIKQSA